MTSLTSVEWPADHTNVDQGKLMKPKSYGKNSSNEGMPRMVTMVFPREKQTSMLYPIANGQPWKHIQVTLYRLYR